MYIYKGIFASTYTHRHLIILTHSITHKTPIHSYILTHKHRKACMYISTYGHKQTNKQICNHATHTHTHKHSDTHTDRCTHSHRYTHTNTHTHSHTHMCVCVLLFSLSFFTFIIFLNHRQLSI